MYRFDFNIEGKAVNEQWNTEASMFAFAAESIKRIAVEDGKLTPVAIYRIARLHEYAAHAFYTAAARTIGHKKSDWYHEKEKEQRMLAEQYYAQLNQKK